MIIVLNPRVLIKARNFKNAQNACRYSLLPHFSVCYLTWKIVGHILNVIRKWPVGSPSLLIIFYFADVRYVRYVWKQTHRAFWFNANNYSESNECTWSRCLPVLLVAFSAPLFLNFSKNSIGQFAKKNFVFPFWYHINTASELTVAADYNLKLQILLFLYRFHRPQMILFKF